MIEAILIVIVSIVLFAIALNPSRKKRSKKFAYHYYTSHDEKLQSIDKSDIAIRPLMGAHEFKIYNALGKEIIKSKLKGKILICPQVPLGAFIQNPNKDDEVWQHYVLLRTDFLFVIRNFQKYIATPFYALEYNGGGHDGDNAEYTLRRDERKQTALKKVGIPMRIIYKEQICQDDNFYKIDEQKLQKEIKSIISELEFNFDKAQALN